MESFRITLLGSGNVAYHLSRAFLQNKIPIYQIYSRNRTKGQELADFAKARYTDSPGEDQLDGDIFIFAVSDHAIGEILDSRRWNDKLLIHTAGSVPADIFSPFSARFGVLYPLQTLLSERAIDYHAMPWFIEASDEHSSRILTKLATSLSCDVRQADSEKRRMLHIAAVFISNFTNHMCSVAKQLSQEKHIPFEVFQPLMKETFDKLLASDPFLNQTGPARRNDSAVIEKHLSDLENHPDWQKIYNFVSRSIIGMYHKEKPQ